ncbi:MAG TPA: citrate/2-methylcitrate synthase, partial [Clostridiales bacterium]|nr:citrate/2-methylcitrate synthase [Clostridiales bacterium]
SIRSDRLFTPDEARLLDLCLILHAEHGGGNNSTFAARVLTSSGTDTYSAMAAGIGSLKGPLHGGANIKVSAMVRTMMEEIEDYTDEGQVADYLEKLLNRQAGDRSGLIYGMGHAVYTLSDPRAIILKKNAEKFAADSGHLDELKLLKLIEALTPQVFSKVKGVKRPICANVDLYSGFVYKMLNIPEDLYTPLFTVARIAGWAAHRIEELLTGGRIIRPAYKSVTIPRDYVPLDERTDDFEGSTQEYVPTEERIAAGD